MVVLGAWVAGALGLSSESAALRLQVVAVTVAAVTGFVKAGGWLRGRLQGPEVVTDVTERLKNVIYRAAENNRAALLGGVHFADLSLAANLGHDEPSSRPRPWIAGLLRYRKDAVDETRTMSSIGALFEDVESRRLLVLGEPGSGKTVLAIELVLQLAAAQGDYLPVRLNMSAWNPAMSLDEWVTEQLQVDYGITRRAAVDLVQGRPRHLLPVLDGLDEMDSEPPADRAVGWTPRRAVAALRSLNEYFDGSRLGPVVVTCRKQRHEQLTRRGEELRDAATVEILPLSGPEIVRYLRPALTGDPAVSEKWKPFVDHVAAVGNHVLHAALSTPWILHLVVSYAEAGNEPDRLLDIAREPGRARERIRDVLLAEYVPAVTKLANRRAAERQVLPGYRPDPADVTRWMRTLAEHLAWQGSFEGDRPTGMSDVDIVPHLLWPVGGWLRVRIAHFAVGFLTPVLLTLSLVLPPTAWYREAAVFFTEIGALPQLVPGLAVGVLVAVASAYFFATWGACWSPWATPYIVRRKRMTAVERVRVSVRSGLETGPSLAVVGALVGGVFLALKALSGRLPVDDLTPGGVVLFVLIFLLFFGLLFALPGVVIGAVIASLGLREVSWDDEEAWSKSPRDALRAEVTVVATASVVLALAGAGALVTMATSTLRTSPVVIMIQFPLVLLTVGLVVRARAWIRYLIFVAFAAGAGSLPPRLGRFLDWALIVGLLRSSGGSYQFRHLELQGALRVGQVMAAR